ncbi:MAG: EAL domain-containing protein [Pseudomonadota bacterium]
MKTGHNHGRFSLRAAQRGVLPGVPPGALEQDLLRALDHCEIEVRFQPQFVSHNSTVSGAEALARWQHPSLGEIGASDLFAIAERAHLVAPLSRHVVAKALDEAASWPETLSLSLNITPEEMGDPRFPADFAELIGMSGLNPNRLMLEITEDLLLRNLEQASIALAGLRNLGFRTALDDFGAGFCNFQYLRELPLDALKLDRIMVEGIPGDPKAIAVLRAIMGLGKALDLDVYAEGIESEIQRAAVTSEGCDYWQGFLRAQPMTSEEMLGVARSAQV